MRGLNTVRQIWNTVSFWLCFVKCLLSEHKNILKIVSLLICLKTKQFINRSPTVYIYSNQIIGLNYTFNFLSANWQHTTAISSTWEGNLISKLDTFTGFWCCRFLIRLEIALSPTNSSSPYKTGIRSIQESVGKCFQYKLNCNLFYHWIALKITT